MGFLRASIAAAAAGALLFSSPRARADDPLFPESGRFSASLSTGIPFIALGEVAYGVTDGFAVGLLGGTTPVVPGVGLRPRAVLASARAVRVEVTVPLVYYPSTGTHDPWVLAMPTLLVDAAFASGARLKIGAGAVGAAYVEWLASLGRDRGDGAVGGVWETLEAGGSVPLSARTSLFGELTGVFDGFRPAGKDWIGGPPFVLALGVTTTL